MKKPPPLVKLDAVGSTNDFLREMARNPATENFTAVMAESQTAGRGQRGASWFSEKGKNLMMSILVKDIIADPDDIFGLSAAVATAVADVLVAHDIPEISIKWPNDMLSGHKKVGGILIENTIGDGIQSIVGIGLNVNQEHFDGLPRAGSLKTATGKTYDKDRLAADIIGSIMRKSQLLAAGGDALWESYHGRLFKKGIPCAFEDKDGSRFMGIIEGVTRNGLLQIADEHDRIDTFGIREIKMLY